MDQWVGHPISIEMYFYYKKECPAQDWFCQLYCLPSYSIWLLEQTSVCSFQICFERKALPENAHSFLIRPLIKANTGDPWSLQDVLFVSISIKQCQLNLGPIISHLINMENGWSTLPSLLYALSPIFNGIALLIVGRPVLTAHWENRGIQYLRDIFNAHGLLSYLISKMHLVCRVPLFLLFPS